MKSRERNLNFQAKCMLKTPIHLNQRSFSDFTTDELDDYAGCIYDLGTNYRVSFKIFQINRIEKRFSYDIGIEDPLGTNFDKFRYWEWYYSFLQYLFNVDGSDKFLCISRVLKERIDVYEKNIFNGVAKEFFDTLFYDLWPIFNRHKIVKRKILEYLADIDILKRREGGYARNKECDYGIGY